MTENGNTDIFNAGGATAHFQKVPGPGPIEELLLGTGVIGLAEMARRQLAARDVNLWSANTPFSGPISRELGLFYSATRPSYFRYS